jgi:hypothetical protein
LGHCMEWAAADAQMLIVGPALLNMPAPPADE